MIANVNEQMWIDFGLDVAVFLDTIAYWLKKNASNNQPRNFKDGRYWTYNTQAAFQKMFPGWKRETIRRIIRNCVKNNLLIVDNFNAKGYDRTCWFSLTARGLEYYPALSHLIGIKPDKSDGDSLVDSNHPLVGSNPPIPTLLPSSSNNTITTSTSKSKSLDIMREMIEVYREEFPNNPQPHKTLISTTLEKVLRTLIKRWPEADPQKRSLTSDSFRLYMRALKKLSPNFSLGGYVTPHGTKKKNNMVTFCRWDTFVQFLEGKYS